MIHLSKLTHFSSALMTFVFAQIFLLNCEVGYGAQANDDKSEARVFDDQMEMRFYEGMRRIYEACAIEGTLENCEFLGNIEAISIESISPHEFGESLGAGGLSDVGGRSEVGPRHWSEMREHRFDRAGHAFESSFKEEISVRDFRSQINFDKSDARLNLSGLGHGLGSSKLNFKSFQSIASFESSLLSEPLDISAFDSRLDDEALKTIEEFSGYLEANAESSEVFDLRASPSKMSSGLLAYARDSGFQVGIETGARVAIGLTPVVGDLADAFELGSGRDFLTYEKLGSFDRALAGLGLIVGSGILYREGLASLGRLANSSFIGAQRLIDRALSSSFAKRFLNDEGRAKLRYNFAYLGSRKMAYSAAATVAEIRARGGFGQSELLEFHNFWDAKVSKQLKERIGDTFLKGECVSIRPKAGEKFYRIGLAQGAFWSRLPPQSQMQSMSDLAMKNKWGPADSWKNFDEVWELTVPDGANWRAYEGLAASQGGYQAGGYVQVLFEPEFHRSELFEESLKRVDYGD